MPAIVEMLQVYHVMPSLQTFLSVIRHAVTMAFDAMESGTRSLHKAKYGLKCKTLYSIKENL